MAEIELIEEIYTYLYEEDNISTEEDRREHLIRYTIMYHQFSSKLEAMNIKKEFIISIKLFLVVIYYNT